MDVVHEELIDLARSARASAAAADAGEVERITLELLTRLAIHLDDERACSTGCIRRQRAAGVSPVHTSA